MMEPIEVPIKHYASEYYDPQKAHDYYMKNRELKGKQSTKGMSDQQKEAWSYSKNSIKEKKKADLTSASEAQKAQMEALRNQATALRDSIRSKLEGLLESLKVTKIEPKKVDPPELITIPENATDRQKALFREQNQRKMNTYNAKVAKAEAEARDATEAARKDSSEKSKAARESASAELKKVGEDLKGVVQKARADYEAAKKATEQKYKDAVDNEYNNIRTQLPSAPEKPKKGAAKPKQPRKPRKKKAEAEADNSTTNKT